MSEKEQDKVIDVGNEEIIDSEEWKDNFLKQGKWIRLFWMLAFSFAYYLSMTFLWLIVFIQFLFVLITDKRSENISGDHSLNKLIDLIPSICKGKFILWTHVTSPLFSSNCYRDFIKSFFGKKTKRSAFSADLIQKFLFQSDKKWISHESSINKWPRSQDLKPTYIINSAAFIATRKTYVEARDRLCRNPFPIISKNNTGFDVDNKDDFEKLKKLKIQI